MHIILEGNTLSPSFNYQLHHLSQHLHHLSITTSPAQHCCPHQTATSQTRSSSPSTSRNSTEYSKLKVNNRIGSRISCSLEFCTCRLILQWNVQVYPHSIELDYQIPHIFDKISDLKCKIYVAVLQSTFFTNLSWSCHTTLFQLNFN